MVYDIDGTRVVTLPPSVIKIDNNGPLYIRANDVEYTSAALRFTIPGTSIEIRARKPPYGFRIVTEGFNARVEMMINRHLSCYANTGLRVKPDNVPDSDENSFCIEETGATPIADEAMDAE